MSVNGVTGNTAAATYGYQTAAQKNNKAEESKNNAANNSGVIYEPSKNLRTGNKPDTEMINRLKAETEARKSQFMEMVHKMISGQGNAQNKADSIWNLLREGKLNVDAATRDQAIQDISEDGFWGVNQTSQRILDFAKAYAGDDPKKIAEMERAFEKGFKMAEKTWGGKLPDISQRTYDAVLAGFQQMRENA